MNKKKFLESQRRVCQSAFSGGAPLGKPAAAQLATVTAVGSLLPGADAAHAVHLCAVLYLHELQAVLELPSHAAGAKVKVALETVVSGNGQQADLFSVNQIILSHTARNLSRTQPKPSKLSCAGKRKKLSVHKYKTYSHCLTVYRHR